MVYEKANRLIPGKWWKNFQTEFRDDKRGATITKSEWAAAFAALHM
jgi:hypothetical protein